MDTGEKTQTQSEVMAQRHAHGRERVSLEVMPLLWKL